MNYRRNLRNRKYFIISSLLELEVWNKNILQALFCAKCIGVFLFLLWVQIVKIWTKFVLFNWESLYILSNSQYPFFSDLKNIIWFFSLFGMGYYKNWWNNTFPDTSNTLDGFRVTAPKLLYKNWLSNNSEFDSFHRLLFVINILIEDILKLNTITFMWFIFYRYCSKFDW